MSNDAYICDAVRTPIGRYAGGLAHVRTDDLAALPIKALMARNPGVDWSALEEVFLGCANQAGEDNRNVARMAALLSGLPENVPGTTINRLCASGLDAVGTAARADQDRRGDLVIAGGVESMSRAPFVMGKAESAFPRTAEIRTPPSAGASSIPAMKSQYGVDSMPETGENVAEAFRSRAPTRTRSPCAASRRPARGRARIFRGGDRCGRSQGRERKARGSHRRRASAAADDGGGSGQAQDSLPQPGNRDGRQCVGRQRWRGGDDHRLGTGGKKHGLKIRGRILGMATAGVAPRVMGVGPVPATQKLMARLGLKIADFDVIELNEAFASQSLAVLRGLGLPDDAGHVNPNGGAIALGHPLGMSGARLALTALHQLEKTGGRLALATLCVGVGQGVALAIERV